MLIYKDGQIKHYKEMFSNVSFTTFGPSDEFLLQHGALKVNMFKEHDRNTEKLINCVPYVENGWAYTVKVVSKTPEDIEVDIATKAARLREARNSALRESDWTQGKDIPDSISNPWALYRQNLRNLPAQEGFPDVELPLPPDIV